MLPDVATLLITFIHIQICRIYFPGSTSTHLVGTLYQEGDTKKEAGFTWLYLAVNMGGTLGPLTYGLIAHFIGWNFGFLCSALGILISMLWLLSNWQLWDKDKQLKPLNLSVKIFLIYSYFNRLRRA